MVLIFYVHWSFIPEQIMDCHTLLKHTVEKYIISGFQQCITRNMAQHPWGRTIEIFGIESPTKMDIHVKNMSSMAVFSKTMLLSD